MLQCYSDRYAKPAEQALSSAGDPHGELKGMLLVVVETADASENTLKAKFSYLL
jgi:mannose-6-phosphate isomerase class I